MWPQHKECQREARRPEWASPRSCGERGPVYALVSDLQPTGQQRLLYDTPGQGRAGVAAAGPPWTSGACGLGAIGRGAFGQRSSISSMRSENCDQAGRPRLPAGGSPGTNAATGPSEGRRASFSDLDSGKRVSVVLAGYKRHLLVDPRFFLFHIGHKLLILQGLLQPLAPDYRTHHSSH